MRFTSGPIPQWPEETTVVGGSYNWMQRIVTTKALSLVNTDKVVKAEIENLREETNTFYQEHNAEFDEHMAQRGIVHGEDPINTRVNYINNYPIATQRQLIEGRTYEAYVVPALLGKTYDLIPREYRPNLLCAGFVNRTELVNRKLLKLDTSAVVGDSSVDQWVPTVLYEGKPIYLQADKPKQITNLTISEPIQALGVDELTPLRPIAASLTPKGWGGNFVKQYQGIRNTFYSLNPLHLAYHAVLGGHVNEDDFYPLLVKGSHYLMLSGGLTADGFKLGVRGSKLKDLGNQMLFDDKPKLDCSWYDLEGKRISSESSFTYSWRLLSDNQPVLTKLDDTKTRLSATWIEPGKHFAVLYEGVGDFGESKGIVIRFVIHGTIDEAGAIELRMPKNYTIIALGADKKLSSTGRYLFTVDADDAFHPNQTGVFLYTGGHVSCQLVDGKIQRTVWSHKLKSLRDYINTITRTPTAKVVDVIASEPFDFSMYGVGTQRMLMESTDKRNQLTRVVVLNKDSRGMVSASRFQFFNSSMLTPVTSENFGERVLYPQGMVNVIGDTPELHTTVWGNFNLFNPGGLTRLGADGIYESADKKVNPEWRKKVADSIDTPRWCLFIIRNVACLLTLTADNKTLTIRTARVIPGVEWTAEDWGLPVTVNTDTLRTPDNDTNVDIYVTLNGDDAKIIVSEPCQLPGVALEFSLNLPTTDIDGLTCTEVSYTDAPLIEFVTNKVVKVAETNVYWKGDNGTVNLPDGQLANLTVTKETVVILKGSEYPIHPGMQFIVQKGKARWIYFTPNGESFGIEASDVKLTDAELTSKGWLFYAHWNGSVLQLA